MLFLNGLSSVGVGSVEHNLARICVVADCLEDQFLSTLFGLQIHLLFLLVYRNL